MSGRIKSGIRKELFGVIFFILVVNVVVLLFMGSTLFERFYQSNKVSELEQSARAIRAAYQENSGEIYDAIGKLENGNAIVSLFEIGGDGRVQMRYHSRTGREEMRPWGDRENAPKPRGEDVDRFQEKMLARLRDSDESFDVRLEESFNPWEDDGMLTLSTRLDDNLYLYIQTPRGYLKSFADLAVKYTALMSIAILLVGAVIIYFVVGRITRPIQGIQRAADKISRLNFSERCEAKGHDEIAMLAGSVNQMSDDLQAAVSRLVEANEVLQNDLVRQQQTDRLRQQFVANVSHELKTPMTTIGGYIDGMLDGTIPPEKQQHYMQIVSGEVRRLSRLVRNMLDIAKLQAMGVEESRKTRFDLGEELSDVLITFEQKIYNKHLDVRVDLPDKPVWTRAERDSITQVIYNLIDNAIKFCPDGGRLALRVQVDGGKARVSVENTGPTIDKDELPLLFDRFHKADKSRSADREGWGLGLYIAKTIVGAHGGDIWATSENGVTQFNFTLPTVR